MNCYRLTIPSHKLYHEIENDEEGHENDNNDE